MPGETIVMLSCSCSCQLLFSWMISLLSWIYIELTLCSQPLLDSNPHYQTEVPSKEDVVTTVATISVWFAFALVLLLPWCLFLSFQLYKQVDNKCEWDSKNLIGLFMFKKFDKAEYFLIAALHCWARKSTLWVLCGCSRKAFWSLTLVMIL